MKCRDCKKSMVVITYTGDVRNGTKIQIGCDILEKFFDFNNLYVGNKKINSQNKYTISEFLHNLEGLECSIEKEFNRR